MLYVDADMIMEGRVTILGAARIDGRFQGDLVCTSLEVGPDGFIEGTVTAERIVIAGQIVGVAYARVVHLAASAIFEGEIYQERMSMDERATLVGEARRADRFEMPPTYQALLARERRLDDEFAAMSTEARVRRSEEEEQARAAFANLRARFPSPRVSS